MLCVPVPVPLSLLVRAHATRFFGGVPERFEETEAMRENLLREATVERERVALAPDRRQSMLDLSLAAAMKPSMEQVGGWPLQL